MPRCEGFAGRSAVRHRVAVHWCCAVNAHTDSNTDSNRPLAFVSTRRVAACPCDGFGETQVGDFAYVKKDEKTMIVKFVDAASGKEIRVLNTKVK